MKGPCAISTHASAPVGTQLGLQQRTHPCVFHSAPAHSGVSPPPKATVLCVSFQEQWGGRAWQPLTYGHFCPMKTPKRCQEGSPG